MKKLLLSFQPYWVEKIMNGEKIYEYRKRFCNEPVIAYMYVSTPVKAVTGIIHLGKSLRRRYVYNRKVEWICSTYIQEGKEACKGIRVKDELLTGLFFTEPMVVEEVIENGEKHYDYTSKRAYDNGERATDRNKEKGCSVLLRVNRSRRTVIEL